MSNESTIAGPGANEQYNGTSPSVTAPADTALSGVPRELHNFLADIEDLIKATTSLTGEELVRARARLGERIAAAKQSARAMGGTIAHQARNTAAVTDSYVHKQPWTAIGLGSVLGVLLGFALARRA